MARSTRSAAAREAYILATEIEHLKPQIYEVARDVSSLQTPMRVTRSRNMLSLQQPTTDSNPGKRPSSSKKRKTQDTVSKDNDINELPHNLGSGKLRTPIQASAPGISPIKKEEFETLTQELETNVVKASKIAKELTLEPAKRAKKTNTYGLTPGVTPFPDWTHPTPEECEEVNRLLSTIHGDIIPPTTIPEPSLTVTGCGEVPSVLDALIRTLLSGATTGRNSAMAFNGLVQRFGILEEGIGKGSVNWDAVRRASVKDVFEAIKRGGLADVKSKNLKAILDMVYEENQERRNALIKGNDSDLPGLKNESEGTKQYEIACADQNFLSLNHLHALRTEQVMVELVKYPGIGPKTAACVLLFCLQRPCFAVDTHIFRITKWLNWVPPDKATEITAFSHLEVRIPDHLKYSLHQLFIRHGKSCPRCRAITSESSAGWDKGCVIDHLVKRTGKRKGGLAASESGKNKKKKSRRRTRYPTESDESPLSESNPDE